MKTVDEIVEYLKKQIDLCNERLNNHMIKNAQDRQKQVNILMRDICSDILHYINENGDDNETTRD